jgi:hypothetical protein
MNIRLLTQTLPMYKFLLVNTRVLPFSPVFVKGGSVSGELNYSGPTDTMEHPVVPATHRAIIGTPA